MNDQLINKRKSLFESLLHISSNKDLINIQLEIVDEIKSCELKLKNGKNYNLKDHIHLLKHYGDILAWVLLDPHTIRQFAKNQQNKGYLIDQKDGFDNTLENAQKALQYDLPIIICDITHSLRMGDILVCLDPELPIVLECKLGEIKEEFKYQGRRGRQIGRAEHILKYLDKGFGKLFGEEKPKYCIDTKIESKYHWEIINQVLNEEAKTGFGFCEVSKYEIIGAIRKDGAFPSETELINKYSHLKSPYFGIHWIPISECWSTIAPPAVWDIEDRFKFDLTEGELVLFHLFDPHALLGYKNEHGGIVKILPNSEFGYEISIGEDEDFIKTSSRFTQNILYGFQKAESVADQMLASARKSYEKSIDLYEEL